MAASCSGFGMTSLRFCGRSFDISWTENLKTPSNAPSDSTISILILLCSGCQIMHEKQISDVILIDGLITNQNALLLPVRGWTEFGKMFGIDCRRFLFSPPPPPSPSPSPSPLLPNFLLTPGGAHSLARLFDLRLEKERKRLLRWLTQWKEGFPNISMRSVLQWANNARVTCPKLELEESPTSQWRAVLHLARNLNIIYSHGFCSHFISSTSSWKNRNQTLSNTVHCLFNFWKS